MRLLAVALVLVSLATIGWWSVAQATSQAVSARWSPRCSGTSVERSSTAVTIASRPGWRCLVTVTIRNGSGRPIRVSHLELPYLGSSGGAEVTAISTQATRVYDAGSAPAEESAFDDPVELEGDDLNAVVPADLVVPAGSSRRVSFTIGRSDHGCNSAATFGLDRWPTVVYTTLHRTFRYRPDQRLMLRTFDDRLDRILCSE